jgi:hypothetical protein
MNAKTRYIEAIKKLIYLYSVDAASFKMIRKDIQCPLCVVQANIAASKCKGCPAYTGDNLSTCLNILAPSLRILLSMEPINKANRRRIENCLLVRKIFWVRMLEDIEQRWPEIYFKSVARYFSYERNKFVRAAILSCQKYALDKYKEITGKGFRLMGGHLR